MNAQAFGQLVRSMRRQRLHLDSKREFRQWSRAHLAALSGLSERQIRRIEQGEVINLYPLLAGLADAFGLTELERPAFYAQAGYLYSPANFEPDMELLDSLLRQIEYPVYIRTPLWDFVAFNRYSARLWGYDDPAVLALFDEEPLGANMLRTVFDPRFEHKRYKGGEANWYEDAQRCILGFRTTSFQYGHTRRYQQILDGLRAYPEFERHWLLSERLPNDTFSPSSPTLEVHHPVYGRMDFISTRLPARYIGGQVDAAVYVPLASSDAAFQRLHEDIASNQVYRFTT
jgi:transcriptional regulator with XRE-family HTH domain